MASTVIAADVGTSSLKAALVDVSGQVLATARRAYVTATPRSGWAEQNPQDWLTALRDALNDLGASSDLSTASGLVFSGQMSAGLLIDAALEPLTPCLIWSDQRAEAETARAKRDYADAAYRITGNPVGATYTAPKLAWFSRHMPDAVKRAAAFVQPKDWLFGRLTGRIATDLSDASCTGLFDLGAKKWSEELFALYGIDMALAPEILAPVEVAGRLTAAMAGKLGLKAGLPVLAGGGDGPVTAAGVGALFAGNAYASFGTSAWISYISATPELSPQSRLATFAHVVPGLLVKTGSMQSAGASLEWAARLLELEPGEIAEMALSLPAPSGAEPFFLPYIQGERSPWWFSGSAGAFIGLGAAHDRDAIAAAILEGILLQFRMILALFEDKSAFSNDLTIVGTFGRSDRFTQRLADAIGLSVRPLLNAEHATALGASILAFTGLGHFANMQEACRWIAYEKTRRPHEEITQAVDRRYEVFKSVWPAMSETTARLHALDASTTTTE
jgi:xylulokinase